MLELLFMDILPLFYTMNFFYVLHEILKARRLQKCHKANWPTHTGNFLDTLVVTKVIVLLKAKMIFIPNMKSSQLHITYGQPTRSCSGAMA